jgi:curved DNA-binding protein CbpA
VKNEHKNYYEILEVAVDASPDEVYKGYTRSKNAYSQDSLALYSLMPPEECEKVLEMIEEAYHILSDPAKRRQYDQARGLNLHLNAQHYMGPASSNLQNRLQEHQLNQDTDSTANKSMTKIVAKKRFSLDYQVDSQFEREIEQMTEFNGEVLKKVREYKNVDIPRMAEMTKVSKTYIRQIEEEDFRNLPASVYVRGFVYQMAKCLKLNPELVANSFLYRLKQAKGE